MIVLLLLVLLVLLVSGAIVCYNDYTYPIPKPPTGWAAVWEFVCDVWEVITAALAVSRGHLHHHYALAVQPGMKLIVGIHRWHMRKFRPGVIAQTLQRAGMYANAEPDGLLRNYRLATAGWAGDTRDDVPLVYVALDVAPEHETDPIDRDRLRASLDQFKLSMQDYDRELGYVG